MLRPRIRQWLLNELRDSREFADTVRSIARDDRVHNYTVWGDPDRLMVHSTAVVNNALFNLESGTITVGAMAFFGHNVALLTGTHDPNLLWKDRQEAIPPSGHDILIEDGAWLASNVTVIGPCAIGRHAVVAAGSVVTADYVDSFAIVAGVPAKIVGRVPEPSPPSERGSVLGSR